MVLPAWAAKAVVTTAVTLALGSVAAWGARVSARAHEHETRITVMEKQQQNIDKSLDEQRQDIKEILRRLPRR